MAYLYKVSAKDASQTDTRDKKFKFKLNVLAKIKNKLINEHYVIKRIEAMKKIIFDKKEEDTINFSELNKPNLIMVKKYGDYYGCIIKKQHTYHFLFDERIIISEDLLSTIKDLPYCLSDLEFYLID